MARNTNDDHRAEWIRRIIYVACIAIPLFLVVLVVFGSVDPKKHQLNWDAITLTTPPPIPPADFLREVRAIGRFGETLDVSEPATLELLYQACTRHEWVERVRHVGLNGPKEIQLDLAFRTPVARLRRAGQMHLVDRLGKLLLPLRPGQGDDLVHLIGWDERQPLEGKPAAWLTTAAALAERLGPDFKIWNVASLDLLRTRSLDLVELCLRTKAGTYICWTTLEGPAKDEPSLEEKLTRLRTYHERYTTLDLPPNQMLDLRDRDGIQRRPLSP
jgi:hypothetical protein